MTTATVAVDRGSIEQSHGATVTATVEHRGSATVGHSEPQSATVEPRRVKVSGDLFHGAIPDGAVYVGRGAPGLRRSPFANPWPVKTYGLAGSRQRYRELTLPVLSDQAVADLAGRDLACWCPLDAEWCHADDLLRVAGTAAVTAPESVESRIAWREALAVREARQERIRQLRLDLAASRAAGKERRHADRLARAARAARVTEGSPPSRSIGDAPGPPVDPVTRFSPRPLLRVMSTMDGSERGGQEGDGFTGSLGWRNPTKKDIDGGPSPHPL